MNRGQNRLIPFAIVTAILATCAGTAPAAEPERTPEAWFAWFGEQWDEAEGWTAGGRRYMRKLDDEGWKARMLTLRGLTRQGKDAIPETVRLLREGDAAQRILAAQTLGYLGIKVPREPLRQAAAEDSDAAVRLYAVDSLGMLGESADDPTDWKALRDSERNGDVKKHIGYAMERAGQPLDPQVVKTLQDWEPATIDSAAVGKPAPDFALPAASGEAVRLSDFRGKHAVVLVFIYGDT